MEAAAPEIAPWVTNIVIAVIILLLGFMVGKLIGIILNKLFKEIQLNKAFHKITKQRYDISSFITGIVSVVIYIVSFFLALDRLNLTETVAIIVAIAIGVIILGSIFLGLRNFIPNIYSGIILKTQKKFLIGQRITVKAAKGKITRISLYRTWLITKDDEKIVVPNRTVLKYAKKY